MKDFTVIGAFARPGSPYWGSDFDVVENGGAFARSVFARRQKERANRLSRKTPRRRSALIMF